MHFNVGDTILIERITRGFFTDSGQDVTDLRTFEVTRANNSSAYAEQLGSAPERRATVRLCQRKKAVHVENKLVYNLRYWTSEDDYHRYYDDIRLQESLKEELLGLISESSKEQLQSAIDAINKGVS